MKPKTKAELQTENDALRRESGLNDLALLGMVRGPTAWVSATAQLFCDVHVTYRLGLLPFEHSCIVVYVRSEQGQSEDVKAYHLHDLQEEAGKAARLLGTDEAYTILGLCSQVREIWQKSHGLTAS